MQRKLKSKPKGERGGWTRKEGTEKRRTGHLYTHTYIYHRLELELEQSLKDLAVESQRRKQLEAEIHTNASTGGPGMGPIHIKRNSASEVSK